LEALGLNLGYVLLQIFMFAIVFVTLRAWLYKPILNMLEKRRTVVAQGLEDARIAAEARANAEREASQIIAEAQAKAAHVVSEATDRADAAARDVVNASEVELAKQRASALAEMEQERNRMLGELRGQVAALAIAAAQKLVGESLDEKRQHTLVQEFFSGIQDGKVTVLDGHEPVTGAAEVISALPLSNDEQETVKKQLLTQMGGSGEVSFRVNPEILGGLVVRVGDKVMDGSVAGQLQTLRQILS
jgi:F-type H+-transporting ATPase subunit b